MKLVLDSSAIVPLLHEEEETKNAFHLMELCQEKGVHLAISPLVKIEVGNCIAQFAKKERKDPRRSLNRFLEMDLEEVPIDDDLLMSAMDLCRRTGITYYDAIHAYGAIIENAPLITLDKELLTKVDMSMDLAECIRSIEAIG